MILTVIIREFQGVELTLKSLVNYLHMSRNMYNVKYIQHSLVSLSLCPLL